MDLFAYTQIDDLEEIAKANGVFYYFILNLEFLTL